MESPFLIFELTKDIVAKYLEDPTPPHRHDYEEVIVITEGTPCHYIDFAREQLQAPMVVYVALGKLHQFSPDINTRGWVIRYQNEYIPQSTFHFYSNFIDSINYPVQSGECLQNMTILCEMMFREYSLPIPNHNMIQHLLGALFAKLEGEGRRNYFSEHNEKNPDLITFNNFLRILEENFRRPDGVEYYAEKLNMPARSLNAISKKVFNKSISEVIESRKLTEARQLLLHSNKTISEIGFELGYNEKSYFSRVFHKKTGLTPSEYKNKMQDLLA
jgi:AraC family transcriptional regulator, transcriptional activator of pobA